MDAAEGNRPEDLNLDKITPVLEDAPITLAVLYGSHARGESRPGSDVDLAVSFYDSLSSVERTRARLSLIERLGRGVDTDGIDVIPIDQAPDGLLADILRDGVVVHGSEDTLEQYRSRARQGEDQSEGFDDVLDDIEALV